MSTKSLSLILAVGGLTAVLTACDGGKCEDTGGCDSGETDTDTDTDADSDTDSDADTDSDTDTDTNPYSTYSGGETLYYASSAETAATQCELTWDATGTPVEYLCDGCEWVFDVDFTFNAGSSSGADHENCVDLASDFAYTYAYTDDYYGYGPTLLLGYYGYYYWWSDPGYATWDGENMTWTYGDPTDFYYYDGSGGYYPQYVGYHLYAQYGWATVK